jgi:hypothetical protein
MELTEIVPWGRSFEEYRLMFGLSGEDLSGRTLGCGDGPASFNAEATSAGHAVVSCDPIYAFAPAAIRRRVEETYETVLAQVRLHPEHFVWEFFHDADELGRHRLAAMHRFLSDFDRGKQEGRYQVACLPRLPFAEGEFRLALVSHLLFLYSGNLNASFHVESALELLRVAGEVRIFPLLTLDRRWSPHIQPVVSALEAAGSTVEIVPVPYEFQRAEGHAGRRMLRAYRGLDRCVPTGHQRFDTAGIRLRLECRDHPCSADTRATNARDHATTQPAWNPCPP